MMVETDPVMQQHKTRRTAPMKLNLERLEILSIQLFLECAALGSISAAAQQCHLSVMAASERLRRLEEALGKALFFRHRRGLELTGPGLAATCHAQVILSAFHLLVDDVNAATPSSRKHAPNSGRRGTLAQPLRQELGIEVVSCGLS